MYSPFACLWEIFVENYYDFDLSKYEDVVVFVDENDERFPTKYLTRKNLLSGGWKGFSNSHNLFERDTLDFQFIFPYKF
ncbi:hypothetical protein H5410_003270 [Solanum commersonii]|uniref:TF-B3 domain-containing protein n=1 Tax=Solanum commersonii TaxID=4109 RepID=A0A9J6B4C5_SOLCO|nr:hypothetical protein H5410_003270 [Solanum commersonii]